MPSRWGSAMSTDSPVPPRVLPTTDGSAAARLVTRVAARIAAGQDAELILVHVTAPTERRVGRMSPAMPLTRRLEDPLGRSVLADARALAFEEGATYVPVLLAGEPADASTPGPRGPTGAGPPRRPSRWVRAPRHGASRPSARRLSG